MTSEPEAWIAASTAGFAEVAAAVRAGAELDPEVAEGEADLLLDGGVEGAPVSDEFGGDAAALGGLVRTCGELHCIGREWSGVAGLALMRFDPADVEWLPLGAGDYGCGCAADLDLGERS